MKEIIASRNLLKNKETSINLLYEVRITLGISIKMGFPSGSDGKESTCHAKDLGSIPGLGRSLGGGHCNSLQYSCLENPHGQRSLAGYSTAAAAAAAATLLQSCPTLCDPTDSSPPGSPVPGILQARTLEWVAISFSSP